MNNNISFAQHIRTSSKARRGFRTFKRTAEIEGFDEKLGAYGVYAPTQYDNFQEMEPEDYPKLFMFYRLENYIVICRSSYEGTDLHSYPPRSGNYLAHSLLCSSKERFNPLQVWMENIWKTKQDIEKEDSSVGVSLEIERLSLNMDGDLDCTQYLKELLSKDSPRGNERALMFTQIVDAIIQRKKVLIVDETKYLEKWTFSLMQVFPEEFVFRYVSITSFATSNALMEVCNVLCFETQNAEKARRYENEQMILVDINAVKTCQPSSYSKVLLESIQSEDIKTFITFRNQVFCEFTESSSYSLEEFVRFTRFFDELYRLGEKNDLQFSEFISNYTQDKQKVDAIFQEMQNQELWDKFILFWRALKKVKPTHYIDHYKEIYKYSVRGLTDEQWIEFEKQVIISIDFRVDLHLVLMYYQVTQIEHPARMDNYFTKIESILEKIDENQKLEAIEFIKQNFTLLNNTQQNKLVEIEIYLKVQDKIKKASSQEQRIILLLENSGFIKTHEQKNKIENLINRVIWKDIFCLIENNRHEDVVKIYNLGYNIRLPHSPLALYIAENEKKGLDSVKIHALYSLLPEEEKTDFLTHATKKIKEIIIEKEQLKKISDLESFLFDYKDIFGEEVILEKFRKDYESNRVIWQLLAIFEDMNIISTKYKAITLIKENNRNVFYKIIDDDESKIPEEYEKVAERLSRKNLIKRETPKSTIKYSYGDLVSIGAMSEFKNIYKKIGNRGLDETDLIKLIKPPWEYFVWRELHKQLNEQDQKEVPALIKKVLHYFNNSKDIDSYRKWCYIACEYFIFCIIDNSEAMFKAALIHLKIGWIEYDFIYNRLRYILVEVNDVSEYFFKHNTNNRTFSNGPKWL